MEGRFISVREVNYFVAIEGTGVPVLLLHGFTGSHQSWNRLADDLREDHLLIVPDLLGHGVTDCPEDEGRFAMEETVADLAEILDQLQVSKCACIGYSMGGRIALAFALTYPERVSRLILESASPGLSLKRDRDDRVNRDRNLADRIETMGIETFVNEWAQIPLFASQKRLSADIRAFEQQIRLAQRAKGLAQSLRGIGTGVQPSFWERLYQLQIPTLLITGELDYKFTNLANEMTGKIPNSTHHIVEDAGHTIHLERRWEYQVTVRDWLRG